MAAIVMDGKALAAKVKERVRRQVEQLDIKPGLAVVLVGDGPRLPGLCERKEKRLRRVRNLQ